MANVKVVGNAEWPKPLVGLARKKDWALDDEMYSHFSDGDYFEEFEGKRAEFEERQKILASLPES